MESSNNVEFRRSLVGSDNAGGVITGGADGSPAPVAAATTRPAATPAPSHTADRRDVTTNPTIITNTLYHYLQTIKRQIFKLYKVLLEYLGLNINNKTGQENSTDLAKYLRFA